MNLYFMKHTLDETELCNLEKRCLFSVVTELNFFFTEEYVHVDRSPFVKYCLKNLTICNSLEELVKNIKDSKKICDDFKVKYLDIMGDMEFHKRHEIEDEIGFIIIGNVSINSPKIVLGVTRIDGQWIIGEYIQNSGVWRKHMERPQGYCNALTSRVARAIVNISTGNRQGLSVIDPCCGVGTVVIEAASMGYEVKGYDINENILAGASRNLRHFDYAASLSQGDIHLLNESCDVVIVDLPYGILSIADLATQHKIIESAARLGKSLTLISIVDMKNKLIELNLRIVQECIISKGKFKRHLYKCEK